MCRAVHVFAHAPQATPAIVERLDARDCPSATSAADAGVAATAAVAGRYVFYNHSAPDGRSARADPRDDAAVAADKSALLPGGTISAANYTNSSRGINGVMIDLAGMAPGAAIDPADFTFTVGNDGNPAGWKPAPAPLSVTVRASPASPALSRVTLIWRDRAVRNEWLRVSVNATSNTGLDAPDVFYVGNLVGDSDGPDGPVARVDDADVSRVFAELPKHAARPPGPAAQAPFDFDHSGKVNRADARAARRNLGAELYAAAPFPTEASGEAIPPPPLPGAWRLAFHDEFTAASLDTVWHPAQYWDHDLTVVGGDELESYDPSGISVGDGMLHLTARKDDVNGVPYVSGLVMTGGEKALPASPRYSFLHGYLEVRAKIPAGKGLWPAIWMMPASFHDDNGEIDVLEAVGDDPSHASFNIHRNGRDEGHGWDGPDLSGGFHTFAVDWEADHVSWFVDGVERARTTRTSLICPEAMYPIMDLAVGGKAAGPPDATTPFPATLDVDYIRIWQTG